MKKSFKFFYLATCKSQRSGDLQIIEMKESHLCGTELILYDHQRRSVGLREM